MNEIEYINEIIQKSNINKNLVSDGYHTFEELYEHRIELWITVCRLASYEDPVANIYPIVWRTLKDQNQSSWDGWFILGITMEGKQISYHLPISKWNECSFAKILEYNKDYDNHTSKQVLERLKDL